MTDEPDKLSKSEKDASPDIVNGEGRPPSPHPMQRMISEFMGISSGPRFHPIFDKFEPEHVTQFLTHTHEDDSEERKYRRSGRWFQLCYVFIVVAIFGALTAFLLPADRELYVEILKMAVMFGAGLGSGYGLKSYLDSRSR